MPIEKRRAPSDKAAEEAWDRIMKIAEEHCLIVNAYGGVATLAVPVEQRKAKCRATVLEMHKAVEFEDD